MKIKQNECKQNDLENRELLVVLEEHISLEKSVDLARKKIFREYLDDMNMMWDIEKLDKTIKKLERELFYLDKTRESIKRELLVKRVLKERLEKSKDKNSKKEVLNLIKEIMILNINCDLYSYAIRLKRKSVESFKEKKKNTHQKFKRRRTKERHQEENMLFIEIDE